MGRWSIKRAAYFGAAVLGTWSAYTHAQGLLGGDDLAIYTVGAVVGQAFAGAVGGASLAYVRNLWFAR